MAVLMDRPRTLPDGRITAHLISDLHGAEGYHELLAVALSLGCHPIFLQYPATYKEHFDLMGPLRIRAALAHPHVTEVRRRRVAIILREKKRLLTGTPVGE